MGWSGTRRVEKQKQPDAKRKERRKISSRLRWFVQGSRVWYFTSSSSLRFFCGHTTTQSSGRAWHTRLRGSRERKKNIRKGRNKKKRTKLRSKTKRARHNEEMKERRLFDRSESDQEKKEQGTADTSFIPSDLKLFHCQFLSTNSFLFFWQRSPNCCTIKL